MLAARILDGELEVTVDGEQYYLSSEEPALATYKAADQVSVYAEEPEAVLSYADEVSSEWTEYPDDSLQEEEAKAKASFERMLYSQIRESSPERGETR